MQATLDPAPADVATPVIDLGSEIEQLRFVLTEIKTAYNAGTPPAQWYVPVSPVGTLVVSHGAHVFRDPGGAGPQTIPLKTLTACIFDTVEYDTGVILSTFDPFFFGGFPTRLTASVAGLYQLSGYLTWDPVFAAAGTLAALIRRNGLDIISATEIVTDANTDDRPMQVGTQVHLNADDYVEVLVFHTFGPSLNINAPTFVLQLLAMDATFPAPTLFTLSITESGDGTGVVTANVQDDSQPTAINCPGTCSEDFVTGTDVFLLATPDDGNDFVQWTGDVPIGHETDNPLLVTMDQARTIDAEFTGGLPHTISFKLATSPTGKVSIQKNADPPTVYTVTNGVDDGATLETDATVDGDTWTMTIFESDGSTPFCSGNPGQSFSQGSLPGVWSATFNTLCGGGEPYAHGVTIDLDQAVFGAVTFNAFD